MHGFLVGPARPAGGHLVASAGSVPSHRRRLASLDDDPGEHRGQSGVGRGNASGEFDPAPNCSTCTAASTATPPVQPEKVEKVEHVQLQRRPSGKKSPTTAGAGRTERLDDGLKVEGTKPSPKHEIRVSYTPINAKTSNRKKLLKDTALRLKLMLPHVRRRGV